jgi:hypothetical protein
MDASHGTEDIGQGMLHIELLQFYVKLPLSNNFSYMGNIPCPITSVLCETYPVQ